MHAVRPSHDAIALAVRWCVLVLASVLALSLVLVVVATAPSRADPGATPDPAGPDQQVVQAQLEAAIRTGTATGTFVGPAGNEQWVGVFGTHSASAGYGYPYPAAPDCLEAAGGLDCVGDSRGFVQGQCTSWVAFRLAARNGLSFSNWYADRHWGNASEWSKVAKGIGHKPDKTPAVGAIGWYKRGHVSYVEDVYSSGSILVSEMNTDGHNGFHFSTVSPGDHGYPDKFIHLDDVIPVDTAAPSVPAGLQVVAHRGRTGVAWRPSTDTFGVAGYRVTRNGVPLATTGRTSYWDTTAPAGQATVYAVVAYDSAGHASRPARVRVKPGTEAVDRAWVETASGPALCGRTGTAKQQRLGCRLLANGAWRYVGLTRTTAWGDPGSRVFVPSRDGGVSYCRAVGRTARTLACTTLDTAKRRWGSTWVSQRTPRLAAADATWVSTSAGPARCGLSGSGPRQQATCSVFLPTGWHSASTTGPTPVGLEDGRAFLADRDGAVNFCRWLPAGRGVRSACTTFDPISLAWGPDQASRRIAGVVPAYGTWTDTAAGPAVCSSPTRSERGGCRVLEWSGWRNTPLPRRVDPGAPGSRVFLTDRSGGVSWCRVIGRGRVAACTGLAAYGRSWGPGRSTRIVPAMQAENRTWESLASGPALCGRTGTLRNQRLACQVLTAGGWRSTTSHLASWGNPGYRAFVPSGSGVAYCRTLELKRGTALSCTPMSKLEWGASRTSKRVRLAYADPF